MDKFDKEESKRIISKKIQLEKEKSEKERQVLLQKVISILKQELSGKDLEVYLVGSITRPYSFSQRSDIDIVVKGYHDDRFDLWTRLEGLFKRDVEVILYEKCPFKEELDKIGLKVI